MDILEFSLIVIIFITWWLWLPMVAYFVILLFGILTICCKAILDGFILGVDYIKYKLYKYRKK